MDCKVLSQLSQCCVTQQATYKLKILILTRCKFNEQCCLIHGSPSQWAWVITRCTRYKVVNFLVAPLNIFIITVSLVYYAAYDGRYMEIGFIILMFICRVVYMKSNHDMPVETLITFQKLQGIMHKVSNWKYIKNDSSPRCLSCQEG